MESVFEAFISNPALYSAGHLVGETLHFPTNTEEVQSLLKRIGVDGVRCQEYFIISFDSDILGLYDYLGEYENIDELNHLAHLLKELSPSERETLEAVMDSGQHCGSVQDLINLTQNLDCYDLHPGVDNEEMLGRLYVEDMEIVTAFVENGLEVSEAHTCEESLEDYFKRVTGGEGIA